MRLKRKVIEDDQRNNFKHNNNQRLLRHQLQQNYDLLILKKYKIINQKK